MSIEAVTVASIMVREVKTARETQTLKAVAKIMADNNIGCVVITRDGDMSAPTGIITERDIVRIAGMENSATLQIPVRDVMSKPIFTISAASSIRDALQQMESKNIRRLPVVSSEKKIVGIITDKDIFRALVKNQTLVTSFCESLMVEYKPVYERLSEFMLGEMPIPGSTPNENF